MMKFCFSQRLAVLVVLATLVFGTHTISLLAQSRRQPPTSDQKKNKRPPQGQETGEKEQEPLPTDIVGKETETVKVSTSLVNVDAVVFNKKSGQITTGLKKDNFELYVDGVKRDITNFSTPEAPITITLVVEYSKLGQVFGLLRQRRPGGGPTGSNSSDRNVSFAVHHTAGLRFGYRLRHAADAADRFHEQSATDSAGDQPAAS